MGKIKNIILVMGILMGFGLALAPVGVGALDVLPDCKNNIDIKDSAVCKSKENDSLPGFLATLANSLLFILGAISVVVIIYAGINYTMSAGDPEVVKKAKNTIIYAIVGLVVAISAYAIVGFVTNQFK